MADDELYTVRLRNDFYRDGFYKVVVALAIISSAIFLLVVTSVILFVKKPSPVVFATDNDWRIFPPVPLTKAYMSTPDLLQWASNVIPKMFTYDFTNYPKEIKSLEQYFTANGWDKMTEALNVYASPDNIQAAKLFMRSVPSGAPIVMNSGILGKAYSWWVQMPLTVTTSSLNRNNVSQLVVQALIVRESTLNNLSGIAIDNVIVTSTKDQGGQAPANEKPST
jgi:hypothetical protein